MLGFFAIVNSTKDLEQKIMICSTAGTGGKNSRSNALPRKDTLTQNRKINPKADSPKNLGREVFQAGI